MKQLDPKDLTALSKHKLTLKSVFYICLADNRKYFVAKIFVNSKTLTYHTFLQGIGDDLFLSSPLSRELRMDINDRELVQKLGRDIIHLPDLWSASLLIALSQLDLYAPKQKEETTNA